MNLPLHRLANGVIDDNKRFYPFKTGLATAMYARPNVRYYIDSIATTMYKTGITAVSWMHHNITINHVDYDFGNISLPEIKIADTTECSQRFEVVGLLADVNTAITTHTGGGAFSYQTVFIFAEVNDP